MPGKSFFSFLFAFLFASVGFAKKPATDPITRESSQVRILELGPLDPNYAERIKLIGRLGIVDQGGVVNSSPWNASGTSTTGVSYFGSGVVAIDGVTCHPYQWSFTIVKAP